MSGNGDVRQFAVTHRDTGLVTMVTGQTWSGSYNATAPANKAGYRFPVDCDVVVIPYGEEVPLPFDEIPLIIRSPGHAKSPLDSDEDHGPIAKQKMTRHDFHVWLRIGCGALGEPVAA